MLQRNEGFVCVTCGSEVAPAHKTCRNHCPHCFTSLHVDDELPGDRASACGGKMFPTRYKIANGVTKIHFVCSICGATHDNKASRDDQLGELDAMIENYRTELFR